MNTGRAYWVGLAALIAASGIGLADDDHDEARRALQAGEVLSLASILEALGDRLGGEVIGVDLDSEDGLFIYELTIVAPGGRIEEVEIDAATGAILEREAD